MTIKNILVAYNGLPGSNTALRGAVLMQQYYDAHLTGLFAHGNPVLSRQMKPWMPKKIQEAIMSVADSPNSDMQDKFSETCANVPPEKLHWIDSGGSVQRTVARYARLFDITVLGMHESTLEQNLSHIDIYPDRVTFDSGRPVIIFPANFEGSLFGKRAVLAWDGGRAAARALADAMQILKAEDEVEIVSVGRSPLADSLPGIDVRTILDRHDVNVTLTELPRSKKSIADTLVNHCDTVGASLLVMGAYEHSPLREGLIGGVTHDIALRAKIPVLMSH
ncbi:universal stress protein [Yoonia sediminilitoris]|uniref:Universal stress protein family protein n=1 Tax=Yoonia sediminilitoris TaxID=1286148 RepID=A0A2T6KHJ5_9RHOB|nr:universal stress protein [Yoonia sediminilitoris]PUB14958.1 universal stress protein family protein [Yoonia sediminilitoris]RCW95674.1 universal stress protein family protein [Yoonia sediminilitoris]